MAAVEIAIDDLTSPEIIELLAAHAAESPQMGLTRLSVVMTKKIA